MQVQPQISWVLTNNLTQGGEGVIMQKIKSPYVCGHSNDLLKIKV